MSYLLLLCCCALTVFAAQPFHVNTTGYSGSVQYQRTTDKEHAVVNGLYAYLNAGSHLLETDIYFLDIYRRDAPVFRQWERTVVYSRFNRHDQRLRLGIHDVISDDAATDGGRVLIAGVGSWRPFARDAGLDVYVSHYPHASPHLTVVQLTPRIGLLLAADTSYSLRDELKGYWIALNREVGLDQRQFFSLEQRLTLRCGRWIVVQNSWGGQQVYAVRNDGFALFNLTQQHIAGIGSELTYIVNDEIALILRVNREHFTEFGRSDRASAITCLGMLSAGF